VKELQGRASAELDVHPHEAFELLAAVERYPDWFEVVSEGEILEEELNGTPGLARARLHLPQSPFATQFELFVAVRTESPVAITLTRVPDGPADPDRLELSWRVEVAGRRSSSSSSTLRRRSCRASCRSAVPARRSPARRSRRRGPRSAGRFAAREPVGSPHANR
jgi:ribosome-associated toxin RatA of RatAB toxin-antitoxin module